MAGKLTRLPFGYRRGKTVLHRAPAGLKLFCVIAISGIASFCLPGLAVSTLLIFAASAAARIPPWQLLRGSRPLAVLSLCIVLFKTFEFEGPGINIFALRIPATSAAGFFEGMVIVLRIFVPFAAAALLFAVTTMRELCLSLKKVSGTYFSLGISLMLGFIPRFFELWEMSNLACEARSCKRGPRRLLIIIPLVIERMMEAAADTALALEARGFGYGK